MKSDAGPEYIRDLARYVEGVMDEIEAVMRQSRQSATQRIAIMAALQIADNYFQTKRQMESMDGTNAAVTERINALIEASHKVLNT